jgi:signal transduction histidine kinase
VRVLRPEEQRILIEVEDTGYGIPAEAQAKLFQRFYRVRIAGAENIEGTGLGLSLVKAVVEQHGGRVAARGEDRGSIVLRIWSPMADGENGDENAYSICSQQCGAVPLKWMGRCPGAANGIPSSK